MRPTLAPLAAALSAVLLLSGCAAAGSPGEAVCSAKMITSSLTARATVTTAELKALPFPLADVEKKGSKASCSAHAVITYSSDGTKLDADVAIFEGTSAGIFERIGDAVEARGWTAEAGNGAFKNWGDPNDSSIGVTAFPVKGGGVLVAVTGE